MTTDTVTAVARRVCVDHGYEFDVLGDRLRSTAGWKDACTLAGFASNHVLAIHIERGLADALAAIAAEN